jgi:hypothetical protein
MAHTGWNWLAIIFIVIAIILVLVAWFSSPQTKLPFIGADKQSLYYSSFFFLLLALAIFSATRAGAFDTLTGVVLHK